MTSDWLKSITALDFVGVASPNLEFDIVIKQPLIAARSKRQSSCSLDQHCRDKAFQWLARQQTQSKDLRYGVREQ